MLFSRLLKPLLVGVMLMLTASTSALAASQQNAELAARIKRIDALYQQVFEDPSNVELNITLVREQIAVHDFKGASGTLDRLLIIVPQNRTAQFLMARVKSATENYQEARYFLLEVINAEDSEDELRANSIEFLAELDDLTDGFSWNATLGVNFGASKNPDAKPDNPAYSLLAPTVPVDVKGGTEEYAGMSLSGLFEYRMNTYEKRILRANLSHQRRDFLTYDKADYETYGAQFQLLNSDSTPFLGALNLTRIRVKDYDFMDQVGISAQQSVTLAQRYRIDGIGSVTRHVNRYSPHFNKNEEKTGFQAKAGAAMNFGFAGYGIRAAYDFERKDANVTTNSYHQSALTLATSIPAGPLNIGANLKYARKRIDSPDFIYSEKRRRDDTATLALSMALPIDLISTTFDDKLNINLSGNVSKTSSNVKKFNTTKGEVTLNFIYGFGGD